MERQLKCNVMLSLKETVLRRIAVLLSNESEISGPLDDDHIWKKWFKTFEDKVKYKISRLKLPDSLKKELIDRIRPISLEIRKWIIIYEWTQVSEVENAILKFYWTTAGTINYKKTAEALLGCRVLDAKVRYELACFYCLEDYIPLLWEELTEDRKKFFLREGSVHPNLKFCWSHILKGKFCDLDCLWKAPGRNLTSFNQWAFEDSARNCNKTAAEYFFRKLTPEEREASIMRTTLYVLSHPDYFGLFFDVLCYLLSIMTPEQQMDTIKEHPVDVLMCFYVLSWQDLLLENASLVWAFLPQSAYGNLVTQISRIEMSFIYDLKSFRKFFLTSPLEFKKYFVHYESEEFETPAYEFLVLVFRKGDSELMECILRNLDAADRVELVFNSRILYLMYTCIEDQRHMVEVCFREAKLSKEDRERLMKELSPISKTIFQLLDESDKSANKKKKCQKRKLESC